MNDAERRDDDTRPLGDELFDTPQAGDPETDAAHPTAPLSTEAPATEPLVRGPLAPEPLPTEPLPAGPARDGETSVLDVPEPAAPAHPGTAPGSPTTPGPAAGAVPPAGPSVPPTTPTAPLSPTVPAEPPSPARRGPRVSTIVWGFVIVAFGVVVLAAALGARVDLGLATIVVLAAAGLTLVVGSIVSGARRRRG